MFSTKSLLHVLALAVVVGLTFAEDAEDLCDKLRERPVDTSFTPWFKAWPNVTSGYHGEENDYSTVQNMACWWYADCIFDWVPETRKQQYGATALIMGLIPLMLKDIAWPRNRIAYVPETLKWWREILVRALGLNPVVDREKIKGTKKFNAGISIMTTLGLWLGLVISLGALALVEVYSKRSSLGCPVPSFVTIWFVIGVIPATIEVGIGRWIQNRKQKKTSNTFSSRLNHNESGQPSSVQSQTRHDTVSSTPEDYVASIGLNVGYANVDIIPGAEVGWFVQLCWAIYYVAGTLLFTSIMLVTVYELIVWVLVACCATATQKMLAYNLCGYWAQK